jgi:hypothetical protein
VEEKKIKTGNESGRRGDEKIKEAAKRKMK